MKEDPTADSAENTPQPELSQAEIDAMTAGNPDDSIPPRFPVDSVLLIDGDNDPHVPPDVRPTRHTLVRVFLRPGAKMPRTLEKKLSHLPHCTTVVSPRGGANAADFVMSLHAGMLHAILPQHIHFLMVTNDATLQAMAAELQRLGRVATIWTSHPDALGMSIEARSESEETFEEPRPRSRSRGGRSRGGRASSRRGGSSRGRSSSRSSAPSRAAEAAPTPPPAPVSDEPRKPGGKTLSEVAWTYAARLQRIKDVPSRLKTLLNDIKNRAGSQGFNPEEVLEELKRHHGVKVDAQGRVTVAKVKPAAEGGSADGEAPEVAPS
ncbi:MAG TPA: hypothetical protein VN915_14195 [Elusimicrobiota bacterium]|nr:hypothetical protein [Elusimicrobiota bacterium]